ncbi:hypothetical protein [Novosphingobium sp. 9]|uniref:hypothetical protein n=1 Tax=Novosphingobium sp. 9 TaxID=2025349 RepID=UPI0021B6AE55|nr:hypothetical protein [Novosphingobium sp. 9]
MTAFAASLFTLAALFSGLVIALAWLTHGRRALGLGSRIVHCSGELTVTWKRVERVAMPIPAQAPRPRGISGRRRPATLRSPRLEWLSPENLAA